MAAFFYSPVAGLILIVTVVMSLIAFNNSDFMENCLLEPFRMLRKKNFLPFITSGFVHADVNHLFFNMLTFFFFAFTLEADIGHWQFAVLYFAGMIIAGLPTFIKHREDVDYACLGASGAVSSVVFGYILFHPLNKLYIMFIPVGIPAFIYALLYLAYCVYAARYQSGRINHSAHFWGSIAGAAITAGFNPGVLLSFIEQVRQLF